MNNKNNKSDKENHKFLAEFVVDLNNNVKVKFAKKLVNLNQYRRTWKRIDARNFARALNRSSLVIK